jgi:predicted dehydrogenase
MTIRVGVIGLNYGLQVHLPAYKANPAFEVVAISARTAAHAEAVAREEQIPNWYTDARQLITSNEVDLVSIASPPRTHAGFAAAAFAAGKHAVIEIGFAPSTLDARVLLDMSAEMHRVGAPAFVMRYTPTVRLVTDMLAEGAIGQPRLMRFEFFNSFLAKPGQKFRWIWDSENGGGVLAGFTSHALDLARRWFGPVREVDAALTTFTDVDIPEGTQPLTGPLADDTGLVVLHFENGVIATFSHSGVTAYPRTGIEIHGTEASLLIEGFGDEATLVPMGESGPQPLYPPEAYLEETRGHSGLLGGFDVFLDKLALAITNGAAPADLPSLADGLEVTRLIDAAKLASRLRRRVRIEEVK